MRKFYSLIIIMLFCFIMTAYSCDSGLYTIYKVGNNSITQHVQKEEVESYVKNYEWSIEPTTLMYTADGRTSWIWNSEISTYENVGWSINPPATIYSYSEERTVLQEEVDDYLATGIWFQTKEEAKPITITMNAFARTNIPPEALEKVLTKGLSGYGQAFYEMERMYGINSIFAISVAELESGNGTSSAFRNKNNAFGIGPGRRFSSVENGIYYFGVLMNKSTYYGKSIDRIGSIYCVGGNWANKVKSLMKNNYAVLGY